MKDIFLYLQIAVLAMNIVALVYIMSVEKYTYKVPRVVFIILCTIGLIVTVGKITFLTVLFSFSPFLSLLNIQQDGTIHKHFERIRGYFRRGKQSMENVQGGSETLHRQKA